MDKRKATNMILMLPGFSDKTTEQFVAGMEKFAQFLENINYKPKPKAVVKPVSNKMAGQNICFTGVRSEETEKWIVANGGKIASGVNEKTTMLIVKDLSSASAKATKARSLNKPILTLTQFTNKYM